MFPFTLHPLVEQMRISTTEKIAKLMPKKKIALSLPEQKKERKKVDGYLFMPIYNFQRIGP